MGRPRRWIAQRVLWNFGKAKDGTQPFCVLIADENGALYGTTGFGGANGSGAVFELTP